MIREPNFLIDRGSGLLNEHWHKFMSYMQCTSLEGKPTIEDRLRVWWLLFTKPQTVDGKTTTPKIRIVTVRLLQFAATVGLSGFLVAIWQWLQSKPSGH